jgi:hypothetical protein
VAEWRQSRQGEPHHGPYTVWFTLRTNEAGADASTSALQVFINKIARTGQAAFVDDDVERMTMVQIKPRKSKPGGSEA